VTDVLHVSFGDAAHLQYAPDSRRAHDGIIVRHWISPDLGKKNIQMTSALVVLPSIPGCINGDGFFLDQKAVSGLQLYSKLWPGPVRSIFRDGPRSSIIFGNAYKAEQLPFEVRVIAQGAAVPDDLLSDAAVILAAGDNFLDLPIAKQAERLNVPAGFIIEYTIGTRLRIAMLSDGSILKKAKAILWHLQTEQKRISAFGRARFIQSNGFPAARAYGKYADNLLYFDTRLSMESMASEDDVNCKIERVMREEPLRIYYTGRLERMKGADHLIDVVRRLDIPFSLDIYGTGSLDASIRSAIRSHSLAEHVRVHDPVDFETELVPLMRSKADLFLCCHVQSDPSCTYLETLGCATPIVGYANSAWAGVAALSQAGWTSAMKRPEKLARKITYLHEHRAELADAIRKSVSFGRLHCFENEFQQRVDQLKRIANC